MADLSVRFWTKEDWDLVERGPETEKKKEGNRFLLKYMRCMRKKIYPKNVDIFQRKKTDPFRNIVTFGGPLARFAGPAFSLKSASDLGLGGGVVGAPHFLTYGNGFFFFLTNELIFVARF